MDFYYQHKKSETRHFDFTCISTNITIETSSADYPDSTSSYHLAENKFEQQDVFLSSYHIDELIFEKVQVEDIATSQPSLWRLAIRVNNMLRYEECWAILEAFCSYISFQHTLQQIAIHDCGGARFCFDEMHYTVRYGNNGDATLVESYFPRGKVVTTHNFKLNKFELCLPSHEINYDILEQFNIAMYSKDVTSRYILLFFFIEQIYETERYQAIKQKSHNKKDRASHLLEYFNDMGIYSFQTVFGEQQLTVTDLFEIIHKRNDLVHRADLGVSQTLYTRLLPIIKEFVKKAVYGAEL